MTYRFLLAVTLVVALPLVAAPIDCRMLEVEVASVDASGAMRPLFNFGQSVTPGLPWSFEFPGKAGTLKTHVTWEGEGAERTPKVTLSLRPNDPRASNGSAVLQKLVWDSLVGPEAFIAPQDKPFILPEYGGVFAVGSVVPTPCGEKTDG